MAKASKPTKSKLLIPASGGEIIASGDPKLRKQFDKMIGNLTSVQFGQLKMLIQAAYEQGIREGKTKAIDIEK